MDAGALRELPLEVWHDHKVIATYPATTDFLLDGADLVIGNRRFKGGEWSGVGKDIKCAYVTPDPTCANCVKDTCPTCGQVVQAGNAAAPARGRGRGA